jgi:hypothetical protein
VEEYVCVTLLGRASEAEPAFAARLSVFWTGLLRRRPDDFARVYAEATAFERRGDRAARQYLVCEEVLAVLLDEATAAGLEHGPIDPDDVHTKYEAVAPDWMQIEH